MKKVFCEKCGAEITGEVDSHFEQFDVGRVVCSNCHEKQKRYISEADLLIYFGFSATFYGAMALLISLIFAYVGFNIFTGILIVAVFAFAFWFQKTMSRSQYEKAYFKEKTKNTNYAEDKKEVGKRLRWQFMAFIVLALMIGTDPKFLVPFILMIIAFVAITFLKVYLLLKNQGG